MSRLSSAVSIAVLVSGSVAAVMAQQAKPTPTFESALSRSWEDVHNRVLAMAKDSVFPDSSSPGSRIPTRAACWKNCGT